MKRLTALLLCCLMVGSFALQSAAAPLGDLFSAQAQVEQKQPEQSDSDTTPSTPAIDSDYATGAQKLDVSQGTVPFIDESDPLMQNLAVYMVELTTDTLIHSRNADVQKYPASLTKIMTAILTLEHFPDLSQELTFTAELQNYVYEINVSYGGGISTGGIVLNETLTVEQLLYAIMLPSANEAAVMLAYEMGDGSLEKFAQMMNDKARELGCTGTNFVNSNGLFNENHYSTAYDMYLITKYALQNETFRKIVSTPSYDTGPTNKQENLHWDSTNKMIVEGSGFYYPQITGVKTGTLEEAGRCLITTAQKDGYEYLLVLMGAPYLDGAGGYVTPNQAFVLTAKFYDWVFDTYTIAPALDTTQPITEVRVAYSTQTDTVMLYPADNMMTLLPAAGGAALTEPVFNVPDELAAPIRQGDVVGTVTLTIQGEVIGTADLIAGSDVSRNQVLYTLSRVSLFFSSTYFKVVIALTIFVVGCYGIYIAGRVLLASRKTR